MITKEDIEVLFTYHAPEGKQFRQYDNIRKAAKEFANIILDNTDTSPDQSTAIRKLRGCVMTANASVALHGKY